MSFQKAIQKINQNGILLVFPILNKKEPNSIWRELHPRKKMLWEWTDNGNDTVAEMWFLMKRLSDCKKVVYSKWYQGRATFFSRKLFVALLSLYLQAGLKNFPLSRQGQEIFELLKDDSPLSTKQIKEMTDLKGKFHEPAYNRAMKQLFSKFLIIAFGEVDDGAFPSLAVGATSVIYEDLWREAEAQNSQVSFEVLETYMPEGSHFRRFFEKQFKELQGSLSKEP